jgi:molybdenum cofactor cytidylyltransferase
MWICRERMARCPSTAMRPRGGEPPCVTAGAPNESATAAVTAGRVHHEGTTPVRNESEVIVIIPQQSTRAPRFRHRSFMFGSAYAAAMTVLAVLLAAGSGSRFRAAEHKLLALLDGRPVHRHALDHVLDAGFTTTIVVTGAVPLDLDPSDQRVVEVRNDRWVEGQATSLQCGLSAAGDRGATAVVVGLADQRRIADAPPDARLVVATYDGVLGPNPVRIDRSLWPLLPETGDEGARGLLRSHRSAVQEVSCPGSADDIDTLEDLQRWKSS